MSGVRWSEILLAAGLLSLHPLSARATVAGGSTGSGLAASARLRAYESGFAAAHMTPSFARQTGLACNACHTHYPELTATGRAFKLNGYVMRRADSVEGRSDAGRSDMSLNLVTPVSFMFQTSFTSTSRAVPGSQTNTVFFPDQLSLFTGGEITPHVGGFLQITFDPQSGQLGMDNADFRYAKNTTLFGQNTVYGFSLNNNPTVQDLWNSTPAWGFPYGSSDAAPSPAAHALIDGELGGQVAGLTAYTMWNNRVYAEAGAYRAAPVGLERPLALDSTDAGLVSGLAPYWRLALPMNLGEHYLSIGAFGMSTPTYTGAGGPNNRFTDVALDLSYLYPMGNNSFTLDATWIHESQHRPSGTANVNNTLRTLRFDAMYHVGHMYAFTVAPFFTSGTADTLLYAPNPMDGSRTGLPDNSGIIGELDYMPWQNLRVQLQYTMYSKFNGASTNYDGSGRNAAHNNTLYILTWLLF